jgi:hypothetical protein
LDLLVRSVSRPPPAEVVTGAVASASPLGTRGEPPSEPAGERGPAQSALAECAVPVSGAGHTPTASLRWSRRQKQHSGPVCVQLEAQACSCALTARTEGSMRATGESDSSMVAVLASEGCDSGCCRKCAAARESWSQQAP